MSCASEAERAALSGPEAVLAAARTLAPRGVRLSLGRAGAGEAAAFRAAVRRLAATLAEAHPEAGPVFPAARTWGHVVWQPALLAVLGAERFGLALRLRDMGQRIGAAGAEGARISGDCAAAGAESVRRSAAGELAAVAEAAFEAVSEAAPLRRAFAWRLLADRVAAITASPQAHRPGTPAKGRASAADRWSTLLGLAAPRRPTLAPGPEGTLQLRRAACCLEFRRTGGAVCDGCPKLLRHQQEQGAAP